MKSRNIILSLLLIQLLLTGCATSEYPKVLYQGEDSSVLRQGANFTSLLGDVVAYIVSVDKNYFSIHGVGNDPLIVSPGRHKIVLRTQNFILDSTFELIPNAPTFQYELFLTTQSGTEYTFIAVPTKSGNYANFPIPFHIETKGDIDKSYVEMCKQILGRTEKEIKEYKKDLECGTPERVPVSNLAPS